MAAALWVPRLHGPLDLRYDAGTYYVLGTSLADGHGYRLLNEPGRIEAIQYPPLLPMIVAAHQRLVGSRDPAVAGRALRRTWAALFVVYALAVHTLARRWLRPGWALVASLLVVLHLEPLWLSDALLTELPFACALVLFLLAAESGERRGLTALCGGAAYLLRASGIALLAAWVVDALVARRRREAALRALLAALPVLAWHGYVAGVRAQPEFAAPAYAYQRATYNFYNVGYGANLAYRDAFAPERGFTGGRDLVRRIAGNASALPERLGESIGVRAEGPLAPVFRLRDEAPPPSYSLALGRSACVLLGIVAAGGVGMLFVDGIRLAPLAWLASLALVTLTPWPSQFGRYLMPLAPITAIGLALVLENASRGASRVAQTAAGATVGVLLAAELVVLATVFTLRHQPAAVGPGATPQRLFFYSQRWRRHDEALAWLARQAAPDAVVATSTPQRLYLASGLRSILPPFEVDPERAEKELREVPVDWVVIDDLEFLDVSRRYAEPAVAAHPEHWQLVYDAAGASRIYRRLPR